MDIEIVVGRTFNSFDEIVMVKKELEKQKFYCLSFPEIRTVTSFNNTSKKKIDERFKYATATVACVHRGKHRDRSTKEEGKGKRNVRVYACQCPYEWKVKFDHSLQKFKVSAAHLEHSPLHPISEEDSKAYREREQLREAGALELLEKELRDGAIPHAVRSRVLTDHNLHIKPKTLQNIKQKELGLPKNEWQDTAAELLKLRQRPGAIVKTRVDPIDGEVQRIYIQLREQRELYVKYGEVIQIDGTYRIARAGVCLYSILIEDNFGVGHAVAYIFLREETEASITEALQTFAKYNDVQRTGVVIVDKDKKEMNAVRTVFPAATLLLCHFHVAQAVDERLSKAGLQRGLRHDIYKSFENALYAKSEEAIRVEQEYLCSLDDGDEDGLFGGLGNYFATNWFNNTPNENPELWSIFYRKDLLTLQNNTNNRIERYHRTIKRNIGNKQVRLTVLIPVLVSMATLRELDRKKKAIQLSVKFAVVTLRPVLEKLSKIYTPYFVGLVEVNLDEESTHSYTLIEEEDSYVVTSKDGRYTIKHDLTQCSCAFYMNVGLPCRHIVYISETEGVRLPVEEYNQRWNINGTPVELEEGAQLHSPIVTRQRLATRRLVTREEMYTEALQKGKLVANELQNVPLPAFRKYLRTYDEFLNCIRRNVPFRLVIGRGNHAEPVADPDSQQEESIDSEPEDGQIALPAGDPMNELAEVQPRVQDAAIRPEILPLDAQQVVQPPVPDQQDSFMNLTLDDLLNGSVGELLMDEDLFNRELLLPTEPQVQQIPLPEGAAVHLDHSYGSLQRPPAQPSRRPTTTHPTAPPTPPLRPVATLAGAHPTPSFHDLDHSYSIRDSPQPGPSRQAIRRPLEDVAANDSDSDDDENALKAAKLSERKQRAGRPRKQRKLDNMKNRPRQFEKRPKKEQKRLFLSWFVGEKKAEELTLSKRLVSEDMVHQFPNQVCSSVQHPTLNIQQFQQLFDEDAWAAVTQMINVKKDTGIMYCRCRTEVNTKNGLLCASCLSYCHFKCEKLKTGEKILGKYFTCSHCYENK